MDYSLMFRLALSLFSTDPRNMRWFNWKRFLMMLIMMPLFMFLLIINRCFLFLDTVFFPRFQQQKVPNPVFIIAAPRSATTYLFHVLAADTTRFTAFRLWEIIFAPSIIQKYCCIFIEKIDRLVGGPVRKSILYLEKKLLGDFSTIHRIGLSLPEEDEGILLWNMSTIYLNFFFPDTEHFAEYFAFDLTMPEAKKQRIMRYYARCVLRHNYVFNRTGVRKFLSKNPAMMAKVKSLSELYPDATVLNINRCPGATIPSTLALNSSIYRFFTSRKTSRELDVKTSDILIEWYKMAEKHLGMYFPGQTVTVDFRKLIHNDEATWELICARLGMEYSEFKKLHEGANPKEVHRSGNAYENLREDELDLVLQKLTFMIPYCRKPD